MINDRDEENFVILEYQKNKISPPFLKKPNEKKYSLTFKNPTSGSDDQDKRTDDGGAEIDDKDADEEENGVKYYYRKVLGDGKDKPEFKNLIKIDPEDYLDKLYDDLEKNPPSTFSGNPT